MSRARTSWSPLPEIVPPLLAVALLGAGLAAVRGAPAPATLALAAGVALLRPRPAVWATALLGLFALGAACILLSGAALPANAVSLVLLAAGLAALAAWQHFRARKRWRSALDAFALRQMAAERPVGQAGEPDLRQHEGEPIMTTATTRMPVHTAGRARTATVWTLSALLALAFVGSGLLKFLSPEMAERFAGWGYPPGFHLLIGGLEIGGGLLLLVPAAAPWAAWVLATVMVGAALTHVRAEEVPQAPPSLVLLGLLALTAYLRGSRAAPADDPSRPRRRMRWWFPAAVLALATANLMNLYLSDLTETPLRYMWTTPTVVLTALLLAVWYVFFTGLRWGTRLKLLGAGLLVLVGVGTALALTVRYEGSATGAGLPRFAWKWSPAPGAALPDLPAIPEPEKARGDLVAGPDDYPQFLGPERRGVVPNVRLARDWSARPPQEVWRQPVGLGWSSFAVVGDSAFTQEQRGDQELVVCYDLKTGKVRWTHADTARFHEAMGGDGPRSTPTVAGGRVYALGATGILNCLDGATGKLFWSRETLKGVPNLEWGKSSSPLVFDDLVLVSGGNTAGPSLLAFNKDNGNPVWQAGHDKSSYSSPVLAGLAGRRQVVMVNARSVTGHDPADGHILWEYSWPGELAKASQPVVLEGDRVFLSAGYGLGCVMLQVKDEGGAARPPEANALAVSERWSNRYLKTQFNNVVVRDGFVYGLDDGMLTCLDLDTGKRRWKGGRYGYGQVLLAGDLILVQAESGSVVLVEATPDRHHELARLPALKGKTWNNPALAGPYLVVRNDQEAACYRLPLEEK